MKKSRYQLVRGTGGSYWNVVDADLVKRSENGQIMGRSHRTKTAAVAALRDLRREEREDLHDVRIAEQRLIDMRAGKSEPVPLEEVMKRYGVEG